MVWVRFAGAFLKQHWEWFAAATVVVIAIVVIVLFARDQRQIGAATVTTQVQQDRSKRLGEARTDERTAQTSSERTGAAAATSSAAAKAVTTKAIEDMHDAYLRPPPAPAAPVTAPVFDLGSLRAPLDTVSDSANRAADAADAAGRADPARTP